MSSNDTDDILKRAQVSNDEAKNIAVLLAENNPKFNRVKVCPKCKAANHISRRYCFKCRQPLNPGRDDENSATPSAFDKGPPPASFGPSLKRVQAKQEIES